MPDAPAVAAAAGAAEAAGGNRQQGGGSILSTVLRMAFMWWLMSWFKGGSQTKTAMTKEPHKFSMPKFHKGDLMDLYVFMMETPDVPHGRYSMADLVWGETAVRLAETDPRNVSHTFEPSVVSAVRPVRGMRLL
jgi:hypothetical protein